MTNLTDKVAIVTGGARGIGRAIAARLGRLGARVVVVDLIEAAALDTVATIEGLGSSAIAVEADISSVAHIDRMFATTIERFGKVDIVVANAGAHAAGMPVLDVTEDDYDRVFATNSKGSYFTLQGAARHVTDRGRIIYVGSSTSCFPMPGHGLYGTSKISSKFLVEILAKEIGHRGVTVNSILPTVTVGAGSHVEALRPGALEFVRNYNPMGRAGTVEDAADACEYLVGDLAGFVSGQHLLVSGGGPA
jgi:3-oxoacyl-[acyl-carrier protein] reductase